jgi:hypothetical protein
MADNLELNEGTGGATLAADDIGGIHHQRVKVQFGVDGAATDVSASDPMPVEGTVELGAATLAALESITVVDGGGSLTVDGEVSVSGTVSVDGSGVTQPVSAVALPLPTGAATSAAQATGNTALAAIQTAVETIDNAISGSEMQVDVVASLPAGDNNIGNVDLASAIPAGTNVIGAVSLSASTANGLTVFRSIDLDETEEEVKGTAGTVYGWYMSNSSSSIRYVKFYNATAANVTVGTTTPVLTFLLPANSTSGVGANALGSVGIAFGTAITVAATTGVADNDTGAPGANEVIVNLFYA